MKFTKIVLRVKGESKVYHSLTGKKGIGVATTTRERRRELTAEGVNPSSRNDFSKSERENCFLYHRLRGNAEQRGGTQSDVACKQEVGPGQIM